MHSWEFKRDLARPAIQVHFDAAAHYSRTRAAFDAMLDEAAEDFDAIARCEQIGEEALAAIRATRVASFYAHQILA